MKLSKILKLTTAFALSGNFLCVVYAENHKTQPKTIVKKVKGGTITLTPIGKNIPKSKPVSEKERWAFLPNIVLEIGNKKITKDSFIKEFKAQIPPNRIATMPPARLKNLAKRFANDMADKYIFLTLAKQDKIIPSPQLVKTEFNKMVKNMKPAELTAFKEKLKKQNMTIQQKIEQIAKDKDAQKNVAINLWLEKHITPKAKVTEAEIQNFYNKNKESMKTPEKVQASHILIKPKKENDPAADKKAKEKAEKILTRLKKGEDFAKLAKEYSDCPSGKRGGDLGEFDRNRMVKPFSDAAFSLPEGKISGLVKTKFGYHIIKVTKHIKAGYIPLEKAAPFIKNFLTRKKQFEEIKKVLNTEKKKLHIKINV